MPNSSINVSEQLPWLVGYDPQALTSFQNVVDQTDATLNPLISNVISALNNWRTNGKSKSDLQSVLVSFYQGVLLNVLIPDCTDLYNGSGFLSYIKTRTTGWEVTVIGNIELGEPVTYTNEQLVSWESSINSLQSETTLLENTKDAIHRASSANVYNAIFRPTTYSGIEPVTNHVEKLMSELGYDKLYLYLNPELEKPE